MRRAHLTWGNTMRRRLALILSLLATPALANSLETFLSSNGGNSCWERSYDAAHLKAHPKQIVTKIRLSTEVQDDGSIYAQLGFNLRKRTGEGGRFDYAVGSQCSAKGEAISCSSEWDAGTFEIELLKAGTLITGVLITNKGMIVNPSNYDSEDIADNSVDLSKSDDAAWLLRRLDNDSCDIY
jgi:hypothetical protein